MAKSEVIFMNEKYMNDITSSIFSNLKERSERREKLSVWGPTKLITTDRSIYGTEHDKWLHRRGVLMPKLKIQKTMDQEIIDEAFVHDENCMSNCIANDIPNSNDQESVKLSEVADEISPEDTHMLFSQKNVKKRTISESEVLEKTFQDWCSKRNKEHEKRKSSFVTEQPTYFSTCKKNKEMKAMKQTTPSSKECLETKCSNVTAKDTEMKMHKEKRSSSYTSECSRNIACVKKESSSAVKTSGPCAIKPKPTSHAVKNESLLIIKVTDGKGDKSFELMSPYPTVARIKKKFLKFSAVIPDVDCGSNEINYCSEAVNIVFSYMFNQSYKSGSTCSPKIGVEVLAASHAWKIDQFYRRFLKDFLLVLTPSNITTVFPSAYHFGLKELCDACKNICPDNTDLNCPTYERSQKTCTVTISTYVEPLTLRIPFHSLEKSFTMSFDRHIRNKIIFEVVSGTYIITGIQIQLNENHLMGHSSENTILEIDCSIKNVSNDQILTDQREQKRLRPRNIIKFKKDLVVNSNEKGEIIVETDTRPYLASAIPAKDMMIKNSKFSLTMQSDFKVPYSDKKLFIIGELFYHEIKSPKLNLINRLTEY